VALALSPLNVEALYLLPWRRRSYLRLPTLAMCACAHAIALLHSATMLTFGVRLLAAVNARADDFDEGRRGAIYAALYTSLPLAAAGLLLRGRFCAISTRALLKLRTRLAGAEQVSKGRLSVRQRRGPTGQQGVALPSEGRLSFVELAPPGNRRSTLVLAPHWSSDRSSSSSDRNSNSSAAPPKPPAPPPPTRPALAPLPAPTPPPQPAAPPPSDSLAPPLAASSPLLPPSTSPLRTPTSTPRRRRRCRRVSDELAEEKEGRKENIFQD